MEASKKVNWSANALLMVSELFDYLTETTSKHFADGYIDELLEFGESLAYKSEHYSYLPKYQVARESVPLRPFQA